MIKACPPCPRQPKLPGNTDCPIRPLGLETLRDYSEPVSMNSCFSPPFKFHGPRVGIIPVGDPSPPASAPGLVRECSGP